MITVLFFGQLRERLQTAKLQVPLHELSAGATIADLRQHLQKNGDAWQTFLGAESCLIALNQTMTKSHVILTENDEVAFFPPVTGG
jgi:molybdopterin converting factor subunit 1